MRRLTSLGVLGVAAVGVGVTFAWWLATRTIALLVTAVASGITTP